MPCPDDIVLIVVNRNQKDWVLEFIIAYMYTVKYEHISPFQHYPYSL